MVELRLAMVSKAMLKAAILGGAAIMEGIGRRRRPTAAPSVVVNVSATTNNDAAAAARINALSNPETAQALRNLQNLLHTQVLTEAEFQAAKDKLLGNQRVSTPAGWYDDGSGRPRWWDGQQWTGHVPGGPERAARVFLPPVVGPFSCLHLLHRRVHSSPARSHQTEPARPLVLGCWPDRGQRHRVDSLGQQPIQPRRE